MISQIWGLRQIHDKDLPISAVSNNSTAIPDESTVIIQRLQNQVSELQTQLTHISRVETASNSGAELSSHSVSDLYKRTYPELPRPGSFTGDRAKFRPWFCQVENYLRMYSTHFGTDVMRIGLFTSLMSDAALAWLMPYVESNSPLLDNYAEFVAELRRVFDDPDRSKNSSHKLKHLRQQNFSNFSEYETQFRLLVQDVDWTESLPECRTYAENCRSVWKRPMLFSKRRYSRINFDRFTI